MYIGIQMVKPQQDHGSHLTSLNAEQLSLYKALEMSLTSKVLPVLTDLILMLLKLLSSYSSFNKSVKSGTVLGCYSFTIKVLACQVVFSSSHLLSQNMGKYFFNVPQTRLCSITSQMSPHL